MDFSETKHLPKVDYTPAELDKGSRMLLAAADIIDRRGLAQCALEDDAGRVCINGAINLLLHGSPEWPDMDVYSKCPAVTKLRRHFDGRCPSIYNNVNGRTKDEVVAKLRAVALGL